MPSVKTLVIGAGAAGITAAISAKRKGDPVVILERMPRIGKKLLASGNGRCNLSNENLNTSFYNHSSIALVGSILGKFDKNKITGFFKELGLETYSEEGRIFPVTNQASSVLKVLEMEISRLAIPIELNFTVNAISFSKDRFLVKDKAGRSIECQRLIISGGGKSYPAFGSDGSCYELAAKMGHKVIKPVPAAVPLVVKDRLCHILQGQKISAKIKAAIGGKDLRESSGDLLFTKYGLSGTSVIDVSEDVSIAINRDNKKDVFLSVDMVPFMSKSAMMNELSIRIKKGLSALDLLSGILPNKFGPALKEEILGLDAEKIAESLKERRFNVLGTRGWNEAEFTSGGVDVKEVDKDTLESKLIKSLYFAGEILDVCGRRGGYNLAWAWASGFIAGSGA